MQGHLRLWRRPYPLLAGVLAVGLLVVVFLGVYPAPLLDLIEPASQAIFAFRRLGHFPHAPI